MKTMIVVALILTAQAARPPTDFCRTGCPEGANSCVDYMEILIVGGLDKCRAPPGAWRKIVCRYGEIVEREACQKP